MSNATTTSPQANEGYIFMPFLFLVSSLAVLGQYGHSPYSPRSLQQVFHRAKDAAKIIQPVTFHSLRHSYATHLHERGTDMKWLGHNRSYGLPLNTSTNTYTEHQSPPTTPKAGKVQFCSSINVNLKLN